MKNALKTAAPWLLIALVACAGTIKVWSSNSVVTAADLNANFQHIHSLMVGGHGARLVDADVSATAAIQATKITGFTSPKAYASMSATCDSSVNAACSSANIESTHVTSISGTGAAGTMKIVLDYTPPNANFGVITSAMVNAYCYPNTTQTVSPQFLITCRDDTGGLVTNIRLSFAVYDQ